MAASGKFGRLLRHLLWDNLGLKLVSLALGAVIFVVIDGELTDERVVPVTKLELPEEWSVENPAALREVRVRLRGSRRRFQGLLGASVSLNLSQALTNPVRGRNLVELRPRLVSMSGVSGLDVVGLQPEQVELELARITKRVLPIKVRFSGTPNQGFLLDQPVLQPSRVTVTSTGELDQAQFIWTEPVDIQGRSSGFTTHVAVSRFIQIGDRELPVNCDELVTVTVRLRPGETRVPLEGVPVQALVPPGAALTIEPKFIKLEAQGAAEDLKDLRPGNVRVFVEWPADWDLTGPPGKSFPEREVTVSVAPPPRVVLRGEKDTPLPVVRIKGALVKP